MVKFASCACVQCTPSFTPLQQRTRFYQLPRRSRFIPRTIHGHVCWHCKHRFSVFRLPTKEPFSVKYLYLYLYKYIFRYRWNGRHMYIFIYIHISTFINIYTAISIGKRKPRRLFTVCSSWKRKFVICPFVYKEANRSYPFANGLNGQNGCAHLCQELYR